MSSPPGSAPSSTCAAPIGAMRTPSAVCTTSWPWFALSSVPVMRLGSSPIGTTIDTCCPTYRSISLDGLTRSNWKFCSSTVVEGSSRSLNDTVVGSIHAATSVNDSEPTPFGTATFRTSFTTP